jgi:uncharacterized protein GlcG (DUF336 family)
MMQKLSKLVLGLLLGSGLLASNAAFAACSDVTYAQLQSAANAVLDAGDTGGFGLNMWVTMVDEAGTVCHVVNTGTKGARAGNSQWLGSRVISAQKANTANAFSLDGVSISSGALYAAVQPGGSLFGLQESNPVDATKAYQGPIGYYGRNNDPLKGKRIGGVNVFGGGIALYASGTATKIGAIGVSGDTSCTDHAFAWKVRAELNKEPGGLAADFEKLTIADTFGSLGDHPTCFADGDIQTEEFGFVEQN